MNKMSARTASLLACSSVAAITLFGIPRAAHAQSAPSQASPDQGLEEIVVTAQKRSERLQEVPIAIQSFSANQLTAQAIQNTNDLPLLIPGFTISSSAHNQLYYLRGVGSQQVGTGESAEVSTFVDGVYQPFTPALNQSINNVSNIEVDKGPQGTLFGRNSTGGVIQINTKQPQHDPMADISLGYANYDTLDGSIYATSGITDNLAANIAIGAHDQRDGWGTDLATGDPVFRKQYYSFRVKLLWDVTDATSVTLSADGDYVKADAGSAFNAAPGTHFLFDESTPAGGKITFPGFFDTRQNTPAHHFVLDGGVSAKVDTDLDWATFESITAFRAEKSNVFVDYDGGPATFAPITVREKQDMSSQEFQLASPRSTDPSDLKWVVGTFILHQDGHTKPFVFGEPLANLAFGAPPGDNYQLHSNTYLNSVAGFAQATATVLADTHLTLGVRYTWDQKEIDGYGLVGNFTIPSTVGHQVANFYRPTFRVALDHDITPDIKVYASYNRGFQSGTFNSNSAAGFTRAADAPLAPEVIDAYETGVKSEWFDRRLQANLSAFYYEYRNLQQQIYIGNVLTTTNAGAADIKGVDLDITARPLPPLTVGIAGEILDAHYSNYVNAPIYSFAPGGALISTPGNASGKYLSFAPKLTGTIYGNYDLDTSLGTFTTTLSFNYNDGYYADPGDVLKEPAYYTLNLSENWQITDEISLMLWSRNLNNFHYAQSIAAVAPLGFVMNTPGDPREYGFTLRYKVGGQSAPPPPPTAYTPPPAVAVAQAAPRSYLVFFDFNKSDLTSQAVAIVDQAAANAAPAKVTKIEVTGHTDTVGSDAYNMRLSRRRAEAVAAELEKKGIASGEIDIIAKGKRDLLVPTADGVREPQNRRVQILYEGGPTS